MDRPINFGRVPILIKEWTYDVQRYNEQLQLESNDPQMMKTVKTESHMLLDQSVSSVGNNSFSLLGNSPGLKLDDSSPLPPPRLSNVSMDAEDMTL